MRVGPLILRLHSRVFEVFSTESSYAQRHHVDTVAFEARPPGRDGRVKVHVGLLRHGELSRGAGRTDLELDAPQFARFEQLVAAVKRVQAAGPEPW